MELLSTACQARKVSETTSRVHPWACKKKALKLAMQRCGGCELAALGEKFMYRVSVEACERLELSDEVEGFL